MTDRKYGTVNHKEIGGGAIAASCLGILVMILAPSAITAYILMLVLGAFGLGWGFFLCWGVTALISTLLSMVGSNK